jgi:hypothetical protein
MHTLQVEALPTSKAKFHGYELKEFLVGEQFSVSFLVTNTGDTPFPGGKLMISIPWEERVRFKRDFELPSLQRGERHHTTQWITQVVRSGLGLFLCEATSVSKGQGAVTVSDKEGNIGQIDVVIGTIFCQTKEEVYTLWALYAAIASLALLVLEKLLSFLAFIPGLLN